MLSTNLKKLRAKTKQTQHELASAMGISMHTVCAWETGRSTPTEENVQKLCVALKTTPDELFAEEDNTTREDWLLDQYISLPENKKRLLDDFIALLGRRAL